MNQKSKGKQNHKLRLTENGVMYFHHADNATKRAMPEQFEILTALKDGEWHITMTFGKQFDFTKQRLHDLLVNLRNMKLIELA